MDYLSRAGFSRIQSCVVAHAELTKKFFGIVLLLIGLAILSGAGRWLQLQVNNGLPDAWLELTVRL